MKVTRLEPVAVEKELRDTGMLYAINMLLLHPLGLALALVYDDAQPDIPIDFELVETSGRKPWSFSPEMDAEGRRKIQGFLEANPTLPFKVCNVLNRALNEPPALEKGKLSWSPTAVGLAQEDASLHIMLSDEGLVEVTVQQGGQPACIRVRPDDWREIQNRLNARHFPSPRYTHTKEDK